MLVLCSCQTTRHVDVRLKFVNGFIKEGEITVVFVNSEENDIDVFTKNTKAQINERSTEKFTKKE